MSKKLFVCNTPYQLLIATHMALNMFGEDVVDVILSNHFSGSEKIAERINSDKIVFRHAYYVESFDFSRRMGKYRRTRLKRYVLYGINIKKELGNFIELIDTYDEMYIANYECFTELVFNYIRRYMNSRVRVFSFEDGYGSLSDDWMLHVPEVEKSSVKRWFDRKILNLWYTPEVYEGYYILRPDYLSIEVNCPVKKIIDIPRNEEVFIKKVNQIFDYKKDECDNYEGKLIFFEESASAEGRDFDGDIQVADKIAHVVGKENIIIKRHPRNKGNRFEKAGYITNINTWIPWEVICLNQNVKDSIMISVGSSSVIMADIIANVNGKSILLLNYLDNRVIKPCHINFIRNTYLSGKKIYFPNNDEELLRLVEQMK